MPGSDQKINYQIRPAKSVERKMLCDLIREIQVITGKREMRYIGFGAKYFVDFLLFHNEFAITDMISIESETDRKKRYEFNKPFKNIKMMYGTTNEVLPQIDHFEDKMNLIWLDFDDSFNENMLIDIETICRNLANGSMFFITCNYSFRGDTQTDKKKSFMNSVGDFFDETIENEYYTNKKLPMVIKSTIDNQIKKILKERNRGKENPLKYMQLIFLTYSDGAPMLTIGGVFVKKDLEGKISGSDLFNKYSFLSNAEEIFTIDIPSLTNKEIQLILQKIPLSEEYYKGHEDEFYGIGYDDICKFEKIYRYYPYYSEGIFNV